MNILNTGKILAFDVWADYAHFRKFYTTTSPLTFSVPPRTALCGLISAIVGLSKHENKYLEYFSMEEAKIGVRIIKPIAKTMIAQNLIHTKNASGPGMNVIKQRTQIRFEFLKNPKYRIYFIYTGSNENLLAFKSLLVKHKTVYTPVLGLSENIANFNFHGEFEYNYKSADDQYIKITTAIPLGQISEEYGTKFDYNAEYFSERHPIMLTRKRVVTKYDDIIFERKGLSIEVKLKNGYYELSNGEGNIVFLE